MRLIGFRLEMEPLDYRDRSSFWSFGIRQQVVLPHNSSPSLYLVGHWYRGELQK
jgi:hypothetical protein